MSARYFISLVASSVGLLAFVSTGCAQNLDSLRIRAAEELNRGHYEEARNLYSRLLSEVPNDPAAVDYAEAFLAEGRADHAFRAVTDLLRVAPASRHLLRAQARVLQAQGRLDEAEESFVAAIENGSDCWACGVDLADLIDDRGRDREARQIYITVYQQYDRGALRTPKDLRAGARAAAKLGRFRDANEAYRLAHEMDARDVETLFQWAELFREKYNDAEAIRTYEEALTLNPRHAPSLVGLAHASQGFERQEELAEKALHVNPTFPDALSILASLRILDGDFEQAASLAQRALEANPNHVESLAHLGSSMLLRGDSTSYAEIERRVQTIDRSPSPFYLVAAANASHRFRYHDAASLARRAVQVDPSSADARAEFGLALLRLGRRSEARRQLEAAFEQDPYNLFASNTLTLIDEYRNFARLESPRFELYIHQDERDVLGPLMLELAEASFDSLGARYPYRPDGKITIEAYNDGDDFAVRVAGVPHRGLLGVSFGDVVAVNTPGAQATDAYNWARTLWHELAHTMAIGVSEHRVPRWFTEGLSVYEEARARPEWGREMELAFLSADREGRILQLQEIERGFTRPQFPGQVILSYYHAGQIIDYLVDRFGFAVVVDVLEAFRNGADSRSALESATGLTVAQLDRQFRETVDARHRELAAAVETLPGVLENEVAELQNVDGAAGPLFAHLRRGRSSLLADDLEGARSAFEAALKLYPAYAGAGNAYEGLASVHRQTGDHAALEAVLRDYVNINEHAHDALLELADLYQEGGDARRAAEMLERSLFVAPYDADVRSRLAALYEADGQYESALRHRRAELALDPSDRAGAYFRLARTLRQSRRTDEAKRAVLQSLEIAPDFRDAQTLLLEIVD